MATSNRLHIDEASLRKLSATDCIGLQQKDPDIPPIVRMVSAGHPRGPVAAWTTRAFDKKPGGGPKGVAYTGVKRVRTITRGGLLRNVCWGGHVCVEVDPGRRFKADDRKNAGCGTAGVEHQSSAKSFAPCSADARASTNLAEQTGCIPSEPAGTRTFSDQSVVPSAKSPFAKTYKTVDGLWGCKGIHAAP